MKFLTLALTVLCCGAIELAAQTAVTNITYSSGQNVTVTDNTISAGSSVTVQSGATVLYQATSSVTLSPGFTAASGADFRAVATGVLYSLTVANGTGGGTYTAGTVVTITANSPPAGQVFVGWVLEGGAGTFANASASSTSFTIATSAASIRARYALAPIVDADGDGMSDSFEQTYFGSTTGGDPAADPDHDGLTNVAEYNLGRNPTLYDQSTSTLGNSTPAGWPNADGNSAVAVGATAGTLQVDKNGAATYSVPLWVTPGTAGMQPQLSLNYSSQGGAGWLGYGWSLGGASAITRGPQTLATDGQIRGLSFSATDRFYLDGQRLIYVGGGTGYGTADAEYRTEIDSVSKIVSYGSAGTGPLYFKVWTKAGLIMEFGDSGNNSAAAAEAQGRSEIATWAISKISDTKNNYMTFSYSEDTTNGEHRLTGISYTGNTGVSPYAAVEFTYEARTDTFSGYVAGSKVSRTQRLKKITSKYGTTVAREYTLDYAERANTGRTILTAIHEKGADGKEYPALTFNYESLATGWSQPNNTKWGAPMSITESGAPARGTGFVDLNGDGRPDFVKYHRSGSTNTIGAWLNDPVNGWVSAAGGAADFLPPDPLAIDGVPDTGSRFADIDGDGRTDFVRNGKVYLNTGTGWSYSAGLSFDTFANDGYPGDWTIIPDGGMFLDLNGDGRVDFLGLGHLRYEFDDHWYIEERMLALLNTGSGWVRGAGYELWVPQDEQPSGSGNLLVPKDYLQRGVRLADINGDGLPDFVQSYYVGGNLQRRVALNTGIGFSEQASNSPYMPPKLFSAANPTAGATAPVGTELIDLNGDGLPDLLYNSNTDGIANVAYLNTGTGWTSAPSNYNSPYNLSWDHQPRGVAFLDVNGDGLADLVRGWEATDRDTLLGTGRGWSGSVSDHNLVRQMSQGGLPNTGTDFVDINGDGLVDQIWNLNNANPKGAAFNTSRGSDRLTSVTNGFNVTASISYVPLTDRDSSGNFTVYTKSANNDDLATTYPDLTERSKVANLIGAMYVVKTVTHDDGVGGQYSLTYRYGALRSHQLRGSLGFGWMQVTDNRTSITTNSAFRQDYPFIGMPSDSATVTSGGVYLSESHIGYAEVTGLSAGTHLPYASQTTETSRDLNNTTIVTTTTSITDIDVYGNVKGMSVSTGDGFTKTTTNAFDNNTSSWQLGRLRTVSVASTGPNGYTAVTRASSFAYDAAGLLETETVQPGDSVHELTTTYGYDQFGNKTSVAVSGPNLTVTTSGDYSSSGTVSRTTTTAYDSKGRFPTSTTNALGHSESYTGYDQVLGVLTQLTGANGLVTSWEYDGFGRKIKETRADSTVSEIRYKWAASGAPTGALYLVETESSGVAPSLSFYDKFGRVIHTMGVSGDGDMVVQSTSYDSMGRAYAKSNPYYSGDTPYWTQTTSFDLLNRPLTVTTPDDQNGTQTTTYSYNGLETKATDPKSRVARTVKNSQGWTISNTRNWLNAGSLPDQNSTVTYGYDAIGNLVSTDAAGTTTSLAYDLRGRKTSMTDADMGTWLYRYNAFGELIWQKDAKGQIVTMSYDALGRMTQRVEAEGTTSWTYDTAGKPSGGVWKGKLASVSAPGSYAESYAYDSLGRPQSVSRTIDGSTYTTETAYDSVGRVSRIKYPVTGIGSGPVSTRNVYNGFGYLKEIRNWLDSDSGLLNSQLQGLVYWRVADGTSTPAYNAAGQIEAEEYGNGLANDRYYSRATGRLLTASIDSGFNATGAYRVQHLAYSYDGVGNVTRRNDLTIGFERDERFEDYDALDRLRSSRVEGVTNSTVTVTYSANGNIASKSDVGAYTYGTRPHAVTAAGVNSYSYDNVGNMLTGAGRDFSWTSFNQMRWVKNAAGQSSEFAFGAGHERVKQIRRSGTAENGGVLSGTTTDTTIYVGALYEKVTTAATNTVEHKHYIMAPTGRVAVVTQSTVNGTVQANTTRYFHTDGLGSITVVSDEAGRVLKRYAYDAWGKQSTRYTNTGSGITNQAPTTRGFTDHEMLSDFGLIHMNGRVYDPVLGRFLSADPNVDDATDAQGFNRYSYVGNNPMNATDPSGFFSLKDALKIVAIVAIAYFTAGWAISTFGTTVTTSGSLAAGTFTATVTAHSAFGALVGNAVLGGLAGGFASGFAGSLLNGGSIGDAFKAGVIGGIVGGISAGIAKGIGDFAGDHEWFRGLGGQDWAHGIAQGALTEATGGEFRHGFYAGFAGSVSGPAVHSIFPDSTGAQTMGAAIVGGTASAIGGGKFANGAVSAAFTYLFNHVGHETFEEGGQAVRFVESAPAFTPAGMSADDYDAMIVVSRAAGTAVDEGIKWSLKRFLPRLPVKGIEGGKPVGDKLPSELAKQAVKGTFKEGFPSVVRFGAAAGALSHGVSIWSKITYQVRHSFLGIKFWGSPRVSYELVVNQSSIPARDSWFYTSSASALRDMGSWEGAYRDAMLRNGTKILDANLGK